MWGVISVQMSISDISVKELDKLVAFHTRKGAQVAIDSAVLRISYAEKAKKLKAVGSEAEPKV
jgi:hypothetical protein